ncbi:hypothetical protein [Falsihalocynthiibacter arcticus]
MTDECLYEHLLDKLCHARNLVAA